MLASYNDARETLNGPTDFRGDGTSVTLMPKTWTREYRELDRCLRKLRDEHPSTYAHLRERYLACQPFNEIVRKVSINDRGNIILPNHTEILTEIDRRKNVATVRLRRWHPWVRREQLNESLDYLAEHFHGEPAISPELRTRWPIAA